MDTTQWLERRLRIMRIAAVAAAVAAVVAAVVWVMIRILITAGSTPDALLILAAVLAVAAVVSAVGAAVTRMSCRVTAQTEQRIMALLDDVCTAQAIVASGSGQVRRLDQQLGPRRPG